MIEWVIHPEPYSENPTNNRQNPKRLLTHAPPLINRLDLISPHEKIGNKIDEKNIGKHIE